MDAASLALRLGHRSRHLPHAVSAVLIAICLIACLASTPAAAQTPSPESASLDALAGIPPYTPVAIRPRAIAAYGALLAASMLTLLYLYRGRAFVVYWIGSWLLIAAALGLVGREYANPTLRNVLTGLALLMSVWAAGLMRLSIESYPHESLRWNLWRLNVISGSALWFLVMPFVLPISGLVLTGTIAAAVLLGWAAAGYLRLAKQTRSAGGLLIGAGLAVIAAVHLLSATISIVFDIASWQPQVSGITVITTLFVALGMHLLVFEDMTDELRIANRRLAGANEEVRRLAITDPLTGCHNRRFFDEVERRELERHRRYGTPLSVVFIDVNHFKRLNDSLGHDRGDAVLWMIGSVLRAHVRQSDYAIRWGGDEFLLLLTCSEEAAMVKVEQLKAAFERERTNAALPDYLKLSVGVAVVTPDEGLRGAIREADSQMYGDKLSV